MEKKNAGRRTGGYQQAVRKMVDLHRPFQGDLTSTNLRAEVRSLKGKNGTVKYHFFLKGRWFDHETST